MRRTFLSEAFRALDLLEEQHFDISQKDDFDEFKMFFEDMDDEEENVTVIDTDAETEEDIEDSYDGKIICDCPVCHSKIFKDIKDIILDDNEELANVGEECPYCYSVDGFKIIGEVAPFHKEYDASAEDKDGNPVDVELSVEDDDVKLEALKRKIRRAQRINENRSHRRCLHKDLNEGLMTYQEWWGQVDENPFDMAKEFGLSCKKIKSNNDETLYEFSGSPKAFDSARRAGYFYSMDLEESLQKLDLETENDLIHVTAETKDEQIVPVDMGLEDKIKDSQPLDDEELDNIADEEPADEELPDEFDVDEFDEESFDELGESYLKQVYNNVRKFHTTKVMGDQSKIFVEGLITFKSGNSKKTLFRFDDYQVGKRNNLKLFGENLNLKTNKKAFTLTGKVKGGKFITEKLHYNYSIKDASGKKTRLSGKVTRK